MKRQKKENNRDYATLHDRAVKRFKRARTVPFWAAGLNIVGAIFVTIVFYNLLSNPTGSGTIDYPTKFLLNGYTDWILYFIINIEFSREGLQWLMILLGIISASGVSVIFILIGYFASNPPRKSMIIAHLVLQSVSYLVLIGFFVFYALMNIMTNFRFAILEGIASMAVQGIIMYFSIQMLVQYTKVINLEKEFHGQNITLTETKLIDLSKTNEKENENYDFLQK